MKVALVHNADAGDAVSLSELVRSLTTHGHDVVATAHPADGVEPLRLDEVELVVAAGGDGTIAATARELVGSSTTLAILPMGTANNIALSLGIPDDPDAAIAGWNTAVPRRFDLGIATGPWGERHFVESVGGGLIAHGIVVMDRRDYTSPTPIAQLARARHAHADVLGLLAPVDWRLVIDDEPVAGTFVLVEILNIAAVGPNLRLADSSPYDGYLTVVAATAADRDALGVWLRDGARGLPPTMLQNWRARAIRIEAGDRLHIDDDVVDEPAPPPPDITVRIDPGAIAVLAP
jgi:diacylglycerol kinase (ATP)